MTTLRTSIRGATLAAVAAVLLILPATVVAHAELDAATPADGATVEGAPEVVAGVYSQAIEPDGSSLVLLDATETELARGGVDPADDHRMAISDLPELAPGEYLVQSVTLSAEDDELDRATWSFTVVAAPASPSPAVATASPVPASAPPTSEPSVSATVTPSGPIEPPADPAGSTAEVFLPIIAGLAIVLVAAGLLLSRRRRPPDQA